MNNTELLAACLLMLTLGFVIGLLTSAVLALW